MIYVRIMGGLGNQMFQYAMAKSMATRSGVDLLLDTEWYDAVRQPGETPREYQLDVFGVEPGYLDVNVRKRLKRMRTVYGVSSRLGNLLSKFKVITKYVPEPLIRRGRVGEKIGTDVYLDGYWQSARYFSDCSDLIRRTFVINREWNAHVSALISKIHSSISVSVHVRRGDYVTNPAARDCHGLCSLEYYQSAMQYIRNKFGAVIFYVFSDDLAWVKEQFMDKDNVVYIDASSLKTKNVDELLLMSMCKHNIIANSSFSWWGAWLNGNNDKVVIAPARWFLVEDEFEMDRIPDSWIRM